MGTIRVTRVGSVVCASHGRVAVRWSVRCVVPYSVVNGWSLTRYGYPFGQENTQPIREDDWEQYSLARPLVMGALWFYCRTPGHILCMRQGRQS